MLGRSVKPIKAFRPNSDSAARTSVIPRNDRDFRWRILARSGRWAPGNPYADRKGYVPIGTLVDYSAGRSNGCTSWSPSDGERILALVKDKPTTRPRRSPAAPGVIEASNAALTA